MKNIINFAAFVSVTIGVYLFEFGLPATTSDYSNLWSFSGGFFTLYGVLYTIWQNIVIKKENENFLVDVHLHLMKTYKTPHTGGYSGDGYAFLNWLWPNVVNQLSIPLTRESVLENSNLKEMAQWLRSIKECGRSKSAELVEVMSPVEVKLALLYLTVSELPKSYKNPINRRISGMALNDKEKALFSL